MTADLLRTLKKILPALAVLAFTIIISIFNNDFTSAKGGEIIYRVLARFIRFTLLLCLPLYSILPIYSFIVGRSRTSLLMVSDKQKLFIHSPVEYWIFRPFQGIGIGLILQTKLLSALQIITGVTTRPFLFFHGGQSQPIRPIVSSAITIVISIFLATLWTLDDTGVRYINRRDQEIKMIGKYVGTTMPIIFGIYGIFSLTASFSQELVLMYLFKIIIILYPPFAIFAVVHMYFLKSKSEQFLKRVNLESGSIRG